MTIWLVALLMAPLATPQARPPTSGPRPATSGALQSAERKFQHIQQNGSRSHPDPTPTVLTEDEVNAYVNSGRVMLPKGVSRVRFQGETGTVTGLARVDFDKLTENSRSANPLLSLFRGVHDVRVIAQAGARGGQAEVHVDSVYLDNMEIPRMALEYFADHYLKPKYPQVGLDSRFALPDRIDTAVIGPHQLTIVQK